MNHVQINLWIALVNTSKVRIFIINIEKSKIKHVLAMSLKCVHTPTIWILYFILSCVIAVTGGPLEKGCDSFIVFAHAHAVSIPTRASCKLPKFPVYGARERGVQSALRSCDEQALAQPRVYPGQEWRGRPGAKLRPQTRRKMPAPECSQANPAISQTYRLLENIKNNILYKSD